MRLYSISDEYVEFLRKKYPRIYSNKEDTRIHTRKYLGVVLEIDGYKFYVFYVLNVRETVPKMHYKIKLGIAILIVAMPIFIKSEVFVFSYWL